MDKESMALGGELRCLWSSRRHSWEQSPVLLTVNPGLYPRGEAVPPSWIIRSSAGASGVQLLAESCPFSCNRRLKTSGFQHSSNLGPASLLNLPEGRCPSQEYSGTLRGRFGVHDHIALLWFVRKSQLRLPQGSENLKLLSAHSPSWLQALIFSTTTLHWCDSVHWISISG